MKNFNGSLSFKVDFEQRPEQNITLAGFLFYCNGIFLQSQLVRNNVLEFSFDNETRENYEERLNLDPKQMRLFIAPVADEKSIENIKSIEQLESLKPYEPVLNTDANGDFEILPIPSNISIFWPFCTCRVTGKISKWFHVGQAWDNRAVCRARVHICEIDAIRYWINKIPDYVIAKIPPIFLNPEEIIKHPIPIPDPSPFIKNELRSEQPQSQNIFGNVSVEEAHADVINNLPELSADIKRSLSSTNLNVIRETLVNNYAILHPWFCYWPIYWPYFYRCRELATVSTDANGRFDTNIIYNCFGDKPDIYIWVEYFLNGVWTTVYNPPIPCNTYWDYTCGTDINIQITDERVPGDCCCNCPVPGELIWVRSVGNTSVAHINQQSYLQAPDNQSVKYDRIGLTDAGANGDWFLSIKDGDFKRPFGGSPSFYMCFGSDLPNTGIYYYRWSYKQVLNADLNAPASADSYKPLIPIGGAVTKGYQYEYFDSHNVRQSAPGSVTLGPLTKGINDNLYIIPPTDPDMAPFSVPELNPEWHEPTYNMNTISFDSTQLKNGSNSGGDGLYEFKLELFDEAGNLLNHIPKTTFKIPDYNNSGYSVNAPDQLLENVTATTADAYNMLMRIDNSKCKGGIFKIKVNGHDASADCCGFVGYKPEGVEADLTLSFLATHPNNFGVFSFGVVKGTCGDVPVADAAGMVIDNAYTPSNPLIPSYHLNSSGIYKKHFAPADLLGNCYDNGNGKAAFAETLYVIAMATDGTYRVSANDAQYIAPLAYPVAAFALEP